MKQISGDRLNASLQKAMNVLGAKVMEIYDSMPYDTTITFAFKGGKILLLNKNAKKTPDGALVISKISTHLTVNIDNSFTGEPKDDKGKQAGAK